MVLVCNTYFRVFPSGEFIKLFQRYNTVNNNDDNTNNNKQSVKLTFNASAICDCSIVDKVVVVVVVVIGVVVAVVAVDVVVVGVVGVVA